MNFVLDASALLRYTDREAGGERVKSLLFDARNGLAALTMSAVNWSEIAHVLRKRFGGKSAMRALETFKLLPFTIIDVDIQTAETASIFHHQHKIPFADSFAAALTELMKATLITADFDFKQAADVGAIEVEFLPTKK